MLEMLWVGQKVDHSFVRFLGVIHRLVGGFLVSGFVPPGGGSGKRKAQRQFALYEIAPVTIRLSLQICVRIGWRAHVGSLLYNFVFRFAFLDFCCWLVVKLRPSLY
jgi:hypothetical protein